MKIMMSFACLLFFFAISNAEKVTILDEDISCPAVCPSIVFNCTNMPAVCANMKNAIHNEGKPSQLTRTTNASQINKNRRDSGCTKMKPGPGMSCDEYPFASTNEGGKGAVIVAVPINENRSQGGQLSAFYRKNDIQDGGCFKVQI